MSIAKSDRMEALEALAARVADQDRGPVENKPTAAELYRQGWRPPLNPTQKRAFDSKAIYILLHGERGSGKGHGGLHMLVNYLFRNNNSLGYVIIKELGMSTEGGAWEELQRTILPIWQRDIGLNWSSVRYDAATKKPYVYIETITGGSSMIMLASLPVANQVEAKVKGRTPEIMVVDEADTLEDDRYFTALLMQLGRRSMKTEPSKLIMLCNPRGPSHWLYKRWFEIPYDPDTGVHDDRYAEFHIPVSENLKNLKPGYYENYVLPAVKNDPTAEARLVRGEWVDRPDSEALFANCFSSKLFVVGEAAKGLGLEPVKGVPIVVSYDLGQGHSSVHFEQVVITKDKIFQFAISEIDEVGKWTPYTKLVPKIIDMMIEWDRVGGCEWQWCHVSDNSAFNQFRAKEGSFDARDVEEISKAHVEKNHLPERYIIRMRACPKGAHSIEARVRMVMEALAENCMRISATCPKTIEMFEHLPPDPENALKPKPKHRYVHNFDSLSYGLFYATRVKPVIVPTSQELKPEYYAVA